MENFEKNRELVENLVRQSPGYRVNQDLFEEMVNESLKRLESFLENSDQSSSEVYIKKIVSTVVMETIKNGQELRKEKEKQSEETNNFQEVQTAYKTDNLGNIVYDIEIEKPDTQAETDSSEEKIKALKDRIQKLNEESPSKEYKKIFEMRFVREMSYQEIAEKLELQENEVIKALQDLFKEIKQPLEK